jgi:hypothetical protein
MEAPGRDILPRAGSFRHKDQQLVDSEPLLYRECTESAEKRGIEFPTGLISFVKCLRILLAFVEGT